jgi:hypothetical protein
VPDSDAVFLFFGFSSPWSLIVESRNHSTLSLLLFSSESATISRPLASVSFAEIHHCDASAAHAAALDAGGFFTPLEE